MKRCYAAVYLAVALSSTALATVQPVAVVEAEAAALFHAPAATPAGAAPGADATPVAPQPGSPARAEAPTQPVPAPAAAAQRAGQR